MSLTLFNIQLKIGKKDYDFEASVDVRVDEKQFSNSPQPIVFASPFDESSFKVSKNSKEFAVTELKTTELTMSQECSPTVQVFTLHFSLNMIKLPARSPKDYRKSIEVVIVPKEHFIRHCAIFGDVGSISFSVYGFTKKQLEDKKRDYEKKQAEAKVIKQRQDAEDTETSERNDIVKTQSSLFENIKKVWEKVSSSRNQQKNGNDNNNNNNNITTNNILSQFTAQDPFLPPQHNDDHDIVSEIDLQARFKALCRFGKRFNNLCLNPNKRNVYSNILQFTCADSSQVINLNPILLRKVNFDRLSHSLGAQTTVLNFDKYFEAKLAMDDDDGMGGNQAANGEDDDFLADWVIVPPPPKPEELEIKSDIKTWCRDQKNFPKMPFQVFVEASPGQGKTVFAKELCRTQPWAPKALALYFPLYYMLALRKELDTLKEVLFFVLKNTFLKNNSNGIDDVKILLKMLEKIDEESSSIARKKRFDEEDELRRQEEKYYEELEAKNKNGKINNNNNAKNQSDQKEKVKNGFESDDDDESIPNDVDQEQVPRGNNDNLINGTTITNIISRIATKVISCDIPIVWVVDDLDYVDRFDSRTFVRRFLDEFISPGGRQSDAVHTVARLTGSPVRPGDSIFCFSRDERKKEACVFYDGIHPSTVFVMERWDTNTCKEAFQNMISSRFPPETPQQEIINLVNFVSESNDRFFGEPKRGSGGESASGMQFSRAASSSNSSLNATISNNTLHTALSATKNTNTSFFTGNPYFMNLLATYVHDVVFSVHGKKQEKQVLLQESIKDSPLRLFEHFVAMRITNSMLNLVGTSLHAKYYGSSSNVSSASKKVIFGPASPEIRRVLDEAGKMAIRLLAALADEGDARYTADCGLGFSALEWMNIPHSASASFENGDSNNNNNHNNNNNNNNNKSGGDESDLVAASKSSASFDAAVKNLHRSRGSTLIKNLADVFTIGGNSDAATDEASTQKNKESWIDYSIIIKSARGAILRSSEFAFSSYGRENEIPMPTWCEVLAAAGVLIKKEPLLPAGTSPASASPTTSNESRNNNNNMMSLSSFPIYSFRNRFDLELFAASFLARSDFSQKVKEALPWTPFFRTIWNSLASHVVACTANDLFRKSPTPSCSFSVSQFVEFTSNRFFTAFQTYKENCVDGLLPSQKREHLHSLREYDLHQNSTASSLFIELAQIVPPSLLLDSLLRLHGTFTWNLPSHFFWFVDACGKFGNFEALEWLMDKIGSNKDLNRRECDEEIWKRMALNAFCAPLNDGIMFKLVELAKVYVPQLQSIEILSERTTLKYYPATEEEEDEEEN